MTLVADAPVVTPPVEQLEEMKNIKPVRKKRAPRHDFGDGRGRVLAHKHDNGKGWVEDTAKVADSVYVGPRAEIYHFANVSGNVRVEGRGRIYGHALVADGVMVKKNAQIYGRSSVRDTVMITDDAMIFDQSVVNGRCQIFGTFRIHEHAHVFSSSCTGNGRIGGEASIVRSSLSGNIIAQNRSIAVNSTLHGTVSLNGYCQILNSTINIYSASGGGLLVHDFVVIADNSQIMVPLTIKNHAVIVRSVFVGNDWTTQPLQTIENQFVASNRRFNSYAALGEYIAGYNQRGNAVYAPPPTRPPISLQPAQRRVMRLHEEAAV